MPKAPQTPVASSAGGDNAAAPYSRPPTSLPQVPVSIPFADVLKNLPGDDAAQKSLIPNASNAPPLTPEPAIVFQTIEVLGYNQPSKVSEIHIFGITQKGHSVLVRLPRFRHYFFYPCPKGIVVEDMYDLRRRLNEKLEDEAIQDIAMEQNQAQGRARQTFLKFWLSNHRRANDLVKMSTHLQEGTYVYKDIKFKPFSGTYGATLPYHLRFMMDKGISVMDWLMVQRENCYEVPRNDAVSRCQIEVVLNDDSMLKVAQEFGGESALLRVLSFDIETLLLQPGDRFPKPPGCTEIIQIGNMVSVWPSSVGRPVIRKIFTVGTCDPIDGALVESFDTEKKMLEAWLDFVLNVDPDILTGYNIVGFDIPFLRKRAEILGVANFGSLGRMRKPSLASDTIGRLVLDLLPYFQREEPQWESHRLGEVSRALLGDTKEDIDYTQIPVLQMGNSSTRRRLAVYCLKDVYLPLMLLEKANCFVKAMELAKQNHVSFTDLYTPTARLTEGLAVKWRKAMSQRRIAAD